MFGLGKKLPEIEAVEIERDALNRLATREQTLRAQHAAALQAKGCINGRPAPKSEQLANMRRLVDEAASRFVQENGQSLATHLSGRLELQSDGTYRDVAPSLTTWSPRGYHSELTLTELCGIAPDAVKAGLESVIKATPASGDEMPHAKRRPALAEADQYIREIEDAHSQLVDAAAALTPPIVIEHLPEVRERRAKEAAIRDREERDTAARAPLEQVINGRARTHSSLINGPSTRFPEGRPGSQ